MPEQNCLRAFRTAAFRRTESEFSRALYQLYPKLHLMLFN